MNASDDIRANARPLGRRLQRTAAAALALCLAAGGVMAQGRHGDDRDGGPRGHDRHERSDRRHDARDDRRPGPPGHARGHGHGHAYGHQDVRDGRHFDRHGYEPRPVEWRRGGRLPPEYRGRNYVVDDYRVYHLQPPPRGYHWVGIGGEFALAAIATGLIAQIVVSR